MGDDIIIIIPIFTDYEMRHTKVMTQNEALMYVTTIRNHNLGF
jgi:hypothetical protein